MSYLPTVNAKGTLAARPAAAAANEGYNYFATDGTGTLYRSTGAAWDTIASVGLADQGTATFLDFTTAAAPANPAAGKIRVYSKTGDTFAQRTSAGVETVFGAGGGGAPTSVPYITTAADATLSAEVVIPGLAAHPDIVPASPHADNDEFAALSGWTTLGTLDASNATDFASHWHGRKATVGLQIHGIYKAGPAIPYAALVKVTDYTAIRRGNFTGYGLAVGDSTPTAWCSFSFSTYNMSVQQDTWTNNTTRASAANSQTNDVTSLPPYLMIAVNSATSIHCWWSQGGMIWRQAFSAVNPGFTPSKIGIVVSANGQEAECAVDYIRFYAGTAGQTFNPTTRVWA